MRLPNHQEVVALYEQYHTPPNIRNHLQVVADITQALGSFHQTNLSLLAAAALLHDLVRIPEQWPFLPATITTPQPHAEINYLLLRSDYPEVAELIRSHSLMTILEPEPFGSMEAQLLYYADKRVNHTTIVTLTERLQTGAERWQVTTQTDRTADLIPKLLALEATIFQPIPYDPTQLETHLKTQTLTAH